MRTKKELPHQFEFLEEYIEWAIPDEVKRLEFREGLSFEDIQEFYNAVLPHAKSIIDYFGEIDEQGSSLDSGDHLRAENLLNLMKGFSDAALSVELHKSPSVPDGLHWSVWKPEHGMADWKSKPRVRLFPKEALD